MRARTSVGRSCSPTAELLGLHASITCVRGRVTCTAFLFGQEHSVWHMNFKLRLTVYILKN